MLSKEDAPQVVKQEDIDRILKLMRVGGVTDKVAMDALIVELTAARDKGASDE